MHASPDSARDPERPAAEHASRELKTILDAIQARIVYLDAEGRVVRHNAYSQRMMGLSDEQVRGRTVAEIGAHLEDPHRRHSQNLQVIRSGKPLLGEIELMQLGGQKRWAQVDKVPTFADDGTVNGMLLFIYDITRRHQAEEDRARRDELLRAVSEGTQELIFVKDRQSRLLFVNEEAAAIHDRSPREMLGHTDEPFFPEETARRIIADDRRIMSSGVAETIEEVLPLESGDRVFMTTKSPWRNEAGEIIGILGIARDITENRRSEEIIEQQRLQLAHASRLSTLGKMTAEISHEVRQPLTTISNVVGTCSLLLESGSLDRNKLMEHLETIATQAERASQILDRIRDYTRPSQSGRIPYDVGEIVRDSLDLLAAECRQAETRVTTVVGDGSLMATVDRIQIQQVIVNLVTNACGVLKSLPVRNRRVQVRVHSQGDDVVVEVEDSGPGFEDGAESKLFEPFFTRRPDGTGLGLSICREIIEAHNGTIDARQDPESGAIFRFSIPRSQE